MSAVRAPYNETGEISVRFPDVLSDSASISNVSSDPVDASGISANKEVNAHKDSGERTADAALHPRRIIESARARQEQEVDRRLIGHFRSSFSNSTEISSGITEMAFEPRQIADLLLRA